MRARFLMLVGFVFAVAGSGAAIADQVDYTGHRVVRVYLNTADELAELLTLTDDVWSEAIGVGPLDARVSPEQWTGLQATALDFEVMIEDVQVLIDRERAGMGQRGGPFDDYLDLDGVNAYVDELVATYPDLASTFVVGTSIEEREIRGIRIGTGGEGKPAILYHGAEHAREWITVPAVLYLATQLLEGYETDAAMRALVERCDWMLVPVMNVDGYSYSWSNDRMWRKNRRKNDNGTYGVDNNRNWGFEWGSDNGSSGNPNNETYRGKSAFSEPETKAMADLVAATPELVAYCDIHSYSQLVMWPWGYTDEYCPDQDEYALIGSKMSQIIRSVHGRSYAYGPVYTTIYPVSGASVDWVYGDQGKNAFCCELRDTGEYGFLLPKEQIIPQCEEIVPALFHYADMRSTPVRITFPNGLPVSMKPGETFDLLVHISDGRETLDPSSPEAYTRIGPDKEFVATRLEDQGGGDYIARLPARKCGADTEYFVSALGVDGDEATSPLGAPDVLYSVRIGELEAAFADDFDGDKGWTVKSENLSTGKWERVDPNGTYRDGQPVQTEDDNPAGTGTKCFITQQGPPGGGYADFDVDGGPTRLISPKLDLSNADDPSLSYYAWVYSVPAGNGTADSLNVDVSNDDGQTWVAATSHSHDPQWVAQELRLRDYITLNDQVRVRFVISDNPNNAATEAAVDDVMIGQWGCKDVYVTGDMNCDGAVDFDDIDGFVTAITSRDDYEATYPDCNYFNADANDDGAVNFNDIDAFVDLLT